MNSKPDNVRFYLPEGTAWYDVNTGSYIKGGQTITAKAPYERMPMYIKAGSILPMGPEIEYTDEKLNAPITLAVYKGSNGSFTLYEDEGLNYNYEKGDYAMIPLKWNDKENTLTIEERAGTFTGMQKERTFKVVLISEQSKASIDDVTKVKSQTVTYKGTKLEVQL